METKKLATWLLRRWVEAQRNLEWFQQKDVEIYGKLEDRYHAEQMNMEAKLSVLGFRIEPKRNKKYRLQEV